MKSFGLINLGVLPLLLEAMTPAYAQHDQSKEDSMRQQEPEARPRVREQGRPERREQPSRKQEARPEKQTQKDGPARRDTPQPRPDALSGNQLQPARPAGRKPQRQPHTLQPSPQARREREGQHRSAWPERRARNWEAEHRTWQDRGGYSGYRIPETRYRRSFGPSHGFRMFSFPLVVVGGFPRFQFGGLWFGVMDPWPEYWSNDWYGDDELYIDYFGGGYYLHNRRHPLDWIAITVYLH